MTIDERKYQLSLQTNAQQADAVYTLKAQLEAEQAKAKELQEKIDALQRDSDISE